MYYHLGFLLLLILVCYVIRSQKDKMDAGDVMRATGGKIDEQFDDFKSKLPEANIVQYHDLKEAAKQQPLTLNLISQHLWFLDN